MNKSELQSLFSFYNPSIKIGSGSGKKITAAELLIIFNNSTVDIARLTKCIPNIRSLSISQYQYKYDLNSDVLGIDDEGGVWYWESTNSIHLTRKTIDYWDSLYTNWSDASANRPREYIRRGKELWLRPAPDTAAYTTTLNGAITESATEMTLTLGTYFPIRFRCLIGSEVIEVQRHSSGACVALVRGLEGTTAASHTNGSTITMRNVLMFTFEKPEAMSANGDDPFNNLTHLTPYHEIILKYAQWKIKPIVNAKYDAIKGETEYKQEINKMIVELKRMPDLRHDKLRMYSYVEQYRSTF